MRRNALSIVRYQRILILRQLGKTFQEIADELEITRQRVWQIHQRASKRIGTHASIGNRQTRPTTSV